MKSPFRIASLFVLAVIVAGCGSDETPKAATIAKLSGDDQCVPLSGVPAERVTRRPLRIRVESEPRKGFFGGKGSRIRFPA